MYRKIFKKFGVTNNSPQTGQLEEKEHGDQRAAETRRMPYVSEKAMKEALGGRLQNKIF